MANQSRGQASLRSWLRFFQTEMVFKTTKSKQTFLGGGNSNIFIFTPTWGRGTQFDEHIFQMGWNHQLVLLGKVEFVWICLYLFPKPSGRIMLSERHVLKAPKKSLMEKNKARVRWFLFSTLVTTCWQKKSTSEAFLLESCVLISKEPAT